MAALHEAGVVYEPLFPDSSAVYHLTTLEH